VSERAYMVNEKKEENTMTVTEKTLAFLFSARACTW
jgi:hypothetical protein